ncbi:hypothetical protein SAMN04488122_5683 [Chitinophaga arvensicola]|uniref:Uncharacterized protein n=1 Tax=Chitinophaga arvensicola TaxID=29529 RepID=A0A1I0SAY0_9BACT|nr:hypothetical protein SAMN04488122_5683 [Chitinophaga arvensicola]
MFFHGTTIGQGLTPPPEYYSNIRIADSLMEHKNCREATLHYDLAFKAFGGMGTPADRYNAARAWACTGNIDSVNKILRNLCSRSRYWNDEKFINDPAFAGIRNKEEFISCFRENKMKYAPAINVHLYNVLDTIFNDDRKYRLMPVMSPYGQIVDTAAKNAVIREMQKADAFNVTKMTAVLDTYGWLSAEEVGVNGNIAQFAVIQHAPFEVQEKYLPLLKKAVAENKAAGSQLALLEDRISVHKNGYQVYGSQLETDPATNTLILFPIIDEVNVNERRKGVGLEPLEEYVKRFHLTYIPKTK